MTNETDITYPGQMAYQARNPCLWPKPVGSRRSHQAPQALSGRQLNITLNICNTKYIMPMNKNYIFTYQMSSRKDDKINIENMAFFFNILVFFIFMF